MSTETTRGVDAVGIKKVIKSDTKNVIKSSSETFSGVSLITGTVSANRRPYDPLKLKSIMQVNNKVLQCIQAMEVNIDGTGFELVPSSPDVEISEQDERTLLDFFEEPYPNTGFIEIRRQLRNDLEATGNAYLAVVTNGLGDVVALQGLSAINTSLANTSGLVELEYPLKRNGTELMVKLPARENSFKYVDDEGNTTHYMEFGSKQYVNAKTGVIGLDIPEEERGGTLIHFKLVEDAKSRYGVPRWINQLPSVIGSRKAEEQNLELLDNGGVPSAIIFLKGGSAVDEAEERLSGFLQGGFETNRAVSVSIQSTEGTIEKSGNVDVQVERFGSETTNDSMYQNYLAQCKQDVRLSFRLPPLFTGETTDFNYATAYISYMVAEAQVFKPERDAVDEIINNTVVKALGVSTARFKSKPISLKNVEEQLRTILALRGMVEPEDMIETVNTLIGTNLVYKEGSSVEVGAGGLSLDTLASNDEELDEIKVAKGATVPEDYSLLDLALDYGRLKNLVVGDMVLPVAEVTKTYESLPSAKRALVGKIVSIAAFQSTSVECC